MPGLNVFKRLLQCLFCAGTTLMLLFIVFGGGVDSSPFNHFYWVQADTSKIPSANADVTRWTFWGVCKLSDWSSAAYDSCPGLGPAVPISPIDNFGNSTVGIPTDFINNRDNYYYLSRFSFAFILIALIFSGIGFIGSLFALFWQSMANVITFFVSLSLLFCLVASCLITAVSVMTRNQFHKEHLDAKINAASFGMIWASTGCLLILVLLSCTHMSVRAYKERKEGQSENIGPFSQQTPGGVAQPEEFANNQGQNESSGIRFFKIRRHQDKTENGSIV